MAERHSTTHSPAASLPVPGDYPCGLTWDGARLWHSDQGSGRIYALDPGGAVVREIACELVRADLAWDGAQLLQVGGRPKRLVVVDPDTGDVVATRPVRPPSGRLTGLEVGPDGIWMCLRGPTVLQRRDPATLAVEVEYPVPGSAPSGLTWADGAVIHGDYDDGVLYVTDAASGAARGTVAVTGRPTGLTWDGARLWYCDFPGRRIRPVELDVA